MAHNIVCHIEDTNMESYGAWVTDVEIVVATHLLGVNIAMCSEHDGHYCVNGPWLVDPDQSMDNINPTICFFHWQSF